MGVGPGHYRDACRTPAFLSARWPGLFRSRRHAAEIPVERGKNLVFSQLRRSAMPVARRLFLVVSHGRKVPSQAP